MNRFVVTFLVAVVTLFALYSCQQEDVTPLEYKIGVTELSFTKEGGSQDLFVQATADVEVTSSESWCDVVEADYPSEKISKFAVTLSENVSVAQRTAVLDVTIGGSPAGTVNVIQEGYSILVDVGPVNITYKAAEFYVNVQSAAGYDVDFGEASWLSLKEKNEQTALFAATENKQLYPRNAVITFTAGYESYEVSVTQSANDDVPAPDKTGMESDAKTLMKKMTLGINLGNTLEAIGGETSWGAPKTTAAIVKYFRELGFNAVRVPCSWDQWLEGSDGYIVKDSWMSRVKEVVDYIVNNDMYAILNIHWDGGWLENDIPNGYDEDVDAQQRAIWTQIATTFRDYDEHLVFAGTNEPNVENAEQMETLLKYEQTFINAVRATGGRNAYRVLVVQGPSTDIDRTDELMDTLPEDTVEDRMAVEVHYYTPWQFCGMTQDESWGKMHYFWGDDQKDYATGAYAGRWGSNNEEYLSRQMEKMKKKFWDKGVPVIIGEYSVCSTRSCNLGTDAENARAEEGYAKSRAAFNACVVRESKSHGCVPFYWHCEGDLIDRSELKITEQATYEAIIEAGKTQYPD